MPATPCGFFVYLITNLVTGMIYIGITTKKPSIRWGGHVARAKAGSNVFLHCAIRKYGVGAFSFEVIASCRNWEDLCATEIALIAERGSRAPVGYNLTEGGNGALGYRPTAETLKRLSDSHLGQERSEETRRKIGASAKLRPQSHLNKIRKAEGFKTYISDPVNKAEFLERGRAALTTEARAAGHAAWLEKDRNDPEWKAARVAKLRGQKRTPEAKAKMRAAKLGKKMTDEARANMSAAKKGVSPSEAHRAALSEAGKKAWAARRARAA